MEDLEIGQDGPDSPGVASVPGAVQGVARPLGSPQAGGSRVRARVTSGGSQVRSESPEAERVVRLG